MKTYYFWVTLKGKGPFTVFAPTDAAFAKLPEGTVANLLKPERIEVMAKDSIEERKTADISTMPTGLLDTFTQEEIFDLLAYIQSRGQQ